MPNAAIAWKQSNGFYYPPAFHSRNLYFNNVDIRHYVIEPQFMPGTFITKDSAVRPRYCVADPGVFNNFTDIDRQTELNDDDGTLTGLIGLSPLTKINFSTHLPKISNVDPISRPISPAPPRPVPMTMLPRWSIRIAGLSRGLYESCGPDGSANTNPLGCAANGSVWNYNGANNQTYGPLLYRQLLNPGETAAPFIKMMSQDTGQRSTLVPNNGIYYLDTTVDTATQRMAGAVNLSVFEPGKTYHVFTLFASPSSLETFQVFIGKGLSHDYISKNVLAEVGNAAAGQMSFTAMMSWPSGWHPPGAPAGQPDYDATSGILTVTLDLSPAGGSGFADAYDTSIPGRCQPTSFCSWNGSACVCNETALSCLTIHLTICWPIVRRITATFAATLPRTSTIRTIPPIPVKPGALPTASDSPCRRVPRRDRLGLFLNPTYPAGTRCSATGRELFSCGPATWMYHLLQRWRPAIVTMPTCRRPQCSVTTPRPLRLQSR